MTFQAILLDEIEELKLKNISLTTECMQMLRQLAEAQELIKTLMNANKEENERTTSTNTGSTKTN